MKRIIFILIIGLISINLFSQGISTVTIGAAPNDGTGDPIRTAFNKINTSITYLDSLGFVPNQTDYEGTIYFGNKGDSLDGTGSSSEGMYNTYGGILSGDSSSVAKLNTAYGYNTLGRTRSGWSNTAIGANALANGVGTGDLTVSGSGGEFYANTAVGQGSMKSATTASYNTALGVSSMTNVTEGHDNTAFGTHALNQLTTGLKNLGIGRNSLYTNVTGNNNTAVGYGALQFTTISEQVALGAYALQNTTTGANNTGIGYRAMLNGTTANWNTGIGYEVMRNINLGFRNTAVGVQAGYAVAGGDYNCLFGVSAGVATTGNGNNLFGYQAGNSITTGSYNIAIGYDADVTGATTNYQLNIGNLIQGSMTGTKWAVVDDSINYAADAQADDDYEIDIPEITALHTGLSVTFMANTGNTGGATLEITSVGDIDAILKMHDQALASGDIESGQIVTVVWDGTNWQMTSQLAQ